MLTVGSLFSGIGGFDLGLERAGMRVLWQCESDEFCRRVLRKHWPDVECFPDVTELQHPPAVDVICGGFPCQDISVAGRGAGIDGARSGLWSEYARLVGELRPRYVVVENVSALLGRGLGTVLADLASLGYDAEWDCIPAAAVGAPHRRDRVWLVAYPQRDELWEQPGRRSGASGTSASLVAVDGETRPLADADDAGRGERRRAFAVRAEQPAAERCGEAVGARPAVEHAADPGGVGCERWPRLEGGRGNQAERGSAIGDARDDGGASWEHWAVEPDVGRVAHGVPARVDRLRSLGNALVPQIAEWIGRRILEQEGRQIA